MPPFSANLFRNKGLRITLRLQRASFHLHPQILMVLEMVPPTTYNISNLFKLPQKNKFTEQALQQILKSRHRWQISQRRRYWWYLLVSRMNIRKHELPKANPGLQVNKFPYLQQVLQRGRVCESTIFHDWWWYHRRDQRRHRSPEEAHLYIYHGGGRRG